MKRGAFQAASPGVPSASQPCKPWGQEADSGALPVLYGLRVQGGGALRGGLSRQSRCGGSEDVGRFPDPEQSRPVKGPGSPGLRTEPPQSRALAAGTQRVCPADGCSGCAVLRALREAGPGPPHLPLWLASFEAQVPVGLGKPFGQSCPNPAGLEGWPGFACRKWQILLTRSGALGWQADGKRPVR